MKRLRTVKIRGKVWRVRYRVPPGTSGMCDDPSIAGKTIRLCAAETGRERLATFLHELLHAGQWDLSEEAVDELASDISRECWRAGLRWSDEAGR